MSESITNEQHKKLVKILDELIALIDKMLREIGSNYFLEKNRREAEDWRAYLLIHTDKADLLSLQQEVTDRFFIEYSNLVNHSEDDVKRYSLIEDL